MERLARPGVGALVAGCCCAFAASLIAEPVVYLIDPLQSQIHIVPGTPNGDPVTNFVVEEGTRFASTVAVVEQVPGSLLASIGGTLAADLSGETLTFSGDSLLDPLVHEGAPFTPPADNSEGGTASFATEDNFGGLGVFVSQDNVIADLALRDAVASILSGSATIGGTTDDLEFKITGGVLDFAGLELGLNPAFLNLADELIPVFNQAAEPLTGSVDGTITIPLFLDFTFDVFTLGDSRIVIEGQLVATREGGQLTGDYNDSGVVEQADLDLVLLNWGENANPPPANWSNDLPTGSIDQNELDGVLLNWGESRAATAAALIPEPATWWMAVTILFVIVGTNWCPRVNVIRAG